MDNMELRRLFATNLKKTRLLHNLTQEKLAEMVELSVQTIADIESCRTWISDKTLVKLTNCLNISPSQLFLNEKETDILTEKENLQKSISSLIDKTFNKLI